MLTKNKILAFVYIFQTFQDIFETLYRILFFKYGDLLLSCQMDLGQAWLAQGHGSD
jgi:hypothetical protein